MNRTINTAAVKAVADALKAHYGPLGDPDEGTLCDCGAVVAPVGEYGVRAWREHVAGAALDAVLPHLGAAPSAPACAGCGLAQREHQPGYAASRCAYTPSAAPSATRDEVRDEIAGHPIGSGYYGTSVGVDEAFEIADALLARFTITPRIDR